MNIDKELALSKLVKQVFDDTYAHAGIVDAVDAAMSTQIGLSLMDFRNGLNTTSQSVLSQRFEVIQALKVAMVLELFKTGADTKEKMDEHRMFIQRIRLGAE